MLLLAALHGTAAAESSWRVDASARGIASVEVEGATQMRRGVVPDLAVRAQRAYGNFLIGGTIGAGFPAFYGHHEASASIDLDHVLRRPFCELVPDDDASIPTQHCDGLRWSVGAGIDSGVGMFYFDAPPETSSSSDALLYWGPFARVRLQVHALSVLSTGRAVGLVFGISLAVANARYMTTGTDVGIRLEPAAELGLSLLL